MPEFCRQLADLSSNYEILSCIPIGRMSSGMPGCSRQLADLSSNYEILSCIPIGRMSSGMPGCSRQLISALTSTTPTATTYPTPFSTTSGTKLINFFAKSQESLVLLKQDFYILIF